MVILFNERGENLPYVSSTVAATSAELTRIFQEQDTVFLYRLTEDKWYRIVYRKSKLYREITVGDLPQIPGGFSI